MYDESHPRLAASVVRCRADGGGADGSAAAGAAPTPADPPQPGGPTVALDHRRDEPPGNYGGPTATIALLPGSPAIGAGIPISGLTTDQRGIARPATDPDIGAFQDRGFSITILSGNNQGTDVGTAFKTPLTVEVKSLASDPVTGVIVTFTAPTAGSQASTNSTTFTAMINANGKASGKATADDYAGSYSVTASAAGAAKSVAFQLSNLALPANITDAALLGVITPGLFGDTTGDGPSAHGNA